MSNPWAGSHARQQRWGKRPLSRTKHRVAVQSSQLVSSLTRHTSRMCMGVGVGATAGGVLH